MVYTILQKNLFLKKYNILNIYIKYEIYIIYIKYI